MRDYVVRRAREVKRYREVSENTGVNYHWLCKLAQDEIDNPGVIDIERLHVYYRALEQQEARTQ